MQGLRARRITRNMTDAPDNLRPARRGPLAAWAQLLRLPNLLTVPGDSIVGYFVAAQALGMALDPAAMILAAAASLLLYAFGLVLNDLADLRTDTRERPDRPLPAGEISKPAAIAGMLVLLLAGLGLPAAVTGPASASTLIAAALAAAIAAYNLLLKRIVLLGPLAMGSCRALSLLLGATLAGWAFEPTWQLLLPAGILLAYIAAVTALAAGETRARKPGLLAWGPLLALMPSLITLVTVAFRRFGADSLTPWLCVYILAWMLARTAYFAAAIAGRKQPELVQAAVGHLIRGLLMIQAAIALALASEPAGLAVFLVTFVSLPVAAFLSRRFYAS